jgi:deazaflavin-dependent oxidoreductase (nitroreductase family)
MDDINGPVIEEFRANGGAVDQAMGGFFKGKPLLLLHHTGAKTGQPRINPLVYATHEGTYVVAATKGGSAHHPHWLLNVRANPDVKVEVGTKDFDAKATVVEAGALRDELYAKFVAIMPEQYAQYEAMTDRRIPVVLIDPTP